MLYRLTRPIAIIALKIFFRKIYFTNADKIPQDKPIILASNHPTAFIEPCILACYQKRSLHFLVRGDLFRKTFARKILTSFKMLPVFRIQDGGYTKLRNNFETFNYCQEALKDHKMIMILAEGNTIQEKRLRPLRKGTGRLAFGAKSTYPDLDIKIVPVGINYTHADKFRKDVMVDFGAPMSVESYFEAYQESSNQGHKALIKDLRAEMESHMVVIREVADEPLVEQLFIVSRNDHPQSVWPILENNYLPLEKEREIANRINDMKPALKDVANRKTNQYFESLRSHQLEDIGIAQPENYSFDNSVIIAIGFLPFLFGYLGNYLPMYLAGWVAKTKVKQLEFKAAVGLTVAVVLYFLYYLGLIIFAIFMKSLFVWGLILMLPIWGYFSLLYKEHFHKWNTARNVSRTDHAIITDLKMQREAVQKFL